MTDDKKHLNAIQKACTDLSSETELVMGEIYGLRQWRLRLPFSEDGRRLSGADPDVECTLLGHRGQAWDLGTPNLAECLAGNRGINQTVALPADVVDTHAEYAILQAARDMFAAEPDLHSIAVGNIQWPLYRHIYRSVENQAKLEEPLPPRKPLEPETDDLLDLSGRTVQFVITHPAPTEYFHLSGSVPRKPHRVPDPGCTCGFYAYTDQDSLAKNSYDDGNSVFGLVKAHGLVTQGTKGFRAEKAEIVALTMPMNVVPPSLRQKYATYYQTVTGAYAPGAAEELRKGEVWAPSGDADAQNAFRHLVPDGIQIHPNLAALLAAAEPFLPRKDAQ